MKRILPLLIGLILIPTLSSCGESKAEKEEKARIEAARQDSIRLANEQKLEIKRKEREKAEASFTTPKGTSYIDHAINHLHNVGSSDGARDRKLGRSRTGGYESQAKEYFVYYYGVPNNDKAKDVYNRAVEAYQKGYNEGYDF